MKRAKKTVDEQVLEMEKENLEVIERLGKLILKRKSIEKKVKDLKNVENRLKEELIEQGILAIGETYNFDDFDLKTNKVVSPVIDSLAAFRKLTTNLKKNELKNIFSQVFTVNKTNLRKYLSEKEIEECVVDEKISYRVDAKEKK